MFDDNPQVQQNAEQPQQTPAPAAESQQPDQPAAPKAPATPPVKTTQEERMWAAIGYIAFLGVVTMAMMPKSEFCKKHASQGIVNFVIWFIGLIVLALPIYLLSLIGFVIILATTVVAVLGIIKSISSQEFKLPVLSDLAKMVPTGAIVGSLTGKTPPQANEVSEVDKKPAEPQTTPEPQQTPAAPAAPEQPTTPQASSEPQTTPPAEELKAEEPAAPKEEETPPQQ